MRTPRPISRLWSLAGLALLLGLWEWGHRAYGALVLPGVADTFRALAAMGRDGQLGPVTTRIRDLYKAHVMAQIKGRTA